MYLKPIQFEIIGQKIRPVELWNIQKAYFQTTQYT